MTNGTPVPVGDPAPTSGLQLSNTAAQGALDLAITCSAGGSAEITASPDVTGALIVPGGSQDVTFSCDTAAPGSYSTTYSCDYIEDGSEAPTGSASYTYTCEVREPMSDVVPDPASGTQLTAALQPGGSASVNVTFDEVADEGIAGSVGCSLADGTDFVIDTALPADVPAGGSLVVTVTGTDPGTDVDSISDTLNCTYFDTDNNDPGVDVSYPILMSIGGAVTNFVTTASYAGGAVPANPAEVTLTCNSGIPLQQSFSGDVTFVVMDLLDGTNCTIDIDGVDADWMVASAESDGVDTGDQCVFLADPGNTYTCDITLVPVPFQFSVTVDWVISAEAHGGVGEFATVTQTCLQVWDTATSTNVDYIGPVTAANPGATNPIVSPELTPDPLGNTVCSAVFDDGGSGSGLEVVNGCQPGIDVPLGSPSPSCTITATAFYEGIPTLNQYGLALMALLMLGIGMVGFRRYA
jgi:hypothetical protein